MISDLTIHQFNQLLPYLKEHSLYYRDKLSGFSHITSREDIVNLPVTTKRDLSGDTGSFMCVPGTEIAEIVSTSGSTGKPLYIGLCSEDLNRLRTIEAHNFSAAGFSKSDTVQLMTTSDRMFIAGQAYAMGLSELSATVVRMGSGNSLSQVRVCRDLGVNALVTVPSYLVRLAAVEPESGWREQIERIMLVGDPIYQADLTHNTLGRQLTRAFARADLFSSYGNTEIQGAFCDCPAHTGMHADNRFFYIEVLDDENRPLPDGETGDLTVTTFGIRSMPLLRYKTGDLTCRLSTPCPCGNPSPRIGPIIARKDNKMKIKGTTFYPSAVIDALHGVPGVADFLLIAEQQNGVDELAVLIGRHNAPSSGQPIPEVLNSILKFTPQVTFTDLETISALRGKYACRKKLFFIDNR